MCNSQVPSNTCVHFQIRLQRQNITKTQLSSSISLAIYQLCDLGQNM